jgi:hypothetical protein
MNITSDPNLWVICTLVFFLGLLIGVFLTAGGRRKWKARYRDETDRREALERSHQEHVRATEEREKEWRERDSLRAAAIKSGPDRDEPAA